MRIGITGTIGCGKTTALAVFNELGFKTLDADAIVKDLLCNDDSVITAIRQSFGDEVFEEDKISTQLLGSVAFSDPDKLNDLEQILHPKVIDLIENTLQTASNKDYVVEIPLLFEKKLARLFDYTICLSASRPVRLARLANKGIPPEVALKRESSQLPLSTKETLADFVLSNSGSLDSLKNQIISLIKHIKS